jgi:hypothetical protein
MHGELVVLAMLLLRMSSSLTALSMIFFEVPSTIRHFHYKSGWAFVSAGTASDLDDGRTGYRVVA